MNKPNKVNPTVTINAIHHMENLIKKFIKEIEIEMNCRPQCKDITKEEITESENYIEDCEYHIEDIKKTIKEWKEELKIDGVFI
tara:strand:+ start:203 stop:454 length:252 start_codon:yes stop_codon:yes gene_type:complete